MDQYNDQTAAKNKQEFALPLRGAAHLASIIFHPMFIPFYVTAFLIYLHPYAFAGFSSQPAKLVLISVFVTTAFFPAFSVFLLKKLGFIESIKLNTQQDRIIPIIISMIFYFSIFYVVKKQVNMPVLFKAFLLATFLCSVAAQMANIKFKISLHALSAGCMMMFFIFMAWVSDFSFGVWVSVAVFSTGMVCTSRFIVSNHTKFDVYAGLCIGMACQLFAIWWFM